MSLKYNLLLVFYAFASILFVNAQHVSIDGLIDLSIVDILNNQTLSSNRLKNTRSLLNSIELELNPVYPYKTEDFIEIKNERLYYTLKRKMFSSNGDFSFEKVPLNSNSNVSYYSIKAISSVFNFSPNRILVTVPNDDPQNITYQANAIGKDNFASTDILYPESLPYMKTLVIKPAKDTPIREYVINKTEGILQSGFIGDILASKWKTAGIVTAIFMMIFPYILEYIDPEAAAEMKERKKARK